MIYYVIYAGVALFMSWLLVVTIAKHAVQLGLVDRPNERSLHVRLTPRGGGLGIVIVWTVGCIVLWVQAGPQHISGAKLAVYMAAALAIAAISLWDDFCSVCAGFRFSIHIGAAFAVAQSFMCFETLGLWRTITLDWVGIPLTIIWIVGMTNVFNFMDGIDGIAGGQGVIASLSWCVAGRFLGSEFVGISAAFLAGGCGGFLILNWAPAKIFMGDVGSAFLGFCLAVFPLGILSGVDVRQMSIYLIRLPLFSVFVLWPFIADSVFTLCRRFLNREKIWIPHRSHLYQRMVLAGWVPSAVAIYYNLWAIASSLTALYFLYFGSVVPIVLIAGLFVVSTLLLVVRLESRMHAFMGICKNGQ